MAKDLVLVDALLLLGAFIQLVLVLRARNFLPKDWLAPVVGLLGGTVGWFLFIRLVSGSQGWSPAAEAFLIGYGAAVCGGGLYVSAFAPMRLNPTTLISLTISFWAVYWTGGAARLWLIPASVMTAAAVVFAAGRGEDSLIFRAALQIWSFFAAALVAWNSIPPNVGKVIGDYRAVEMAHTLGSVEVLVTGAQAFLFAQMGCGLIMLMFEETWSGWLPQRGEDDRVRWPAMAALVVQAAAFILLRKSGGESQSQVMALAVFAALAHGAMTGPDAKSPPPEVDLSFE
jgi:hypothetical protein